MPKCPYCARPLRGFRCRACRRYVLRRVHLVLLIIVVAAVVAGLLEIFTRID